MQTNQNDEIRDVTNKDIVLAGIFFAFVMILKAFLE